MKELFSSGQIADAVMLVMALEAAVLIAWNRMTGSGPRPGALLVMLGAGFFLVLALRTALTGGAWEVMAAALAASGVCHVADLKSRFLPSTREGGSAG